MIKQSEAAERIDLTFLQNKGKNTMESLCV